MLNADDTDKIKKEKIKIIQNNEKELKKIQKNKILDILSTLELFDGKLSLTDIMNNDICLIEQLRDAKLDLNNAAKKIEEKKKKIERK